MEILFFLNYTKNKSGLHPSDFLIFGTPHQPTLFFIGLE
jgi:hypothetical protein